MTEDAHDVTELQNEVYRLQALLDHYRGTCDDCGREGVLLEAHAESFNYEPSLWYGCLEREECERIVRERKEAEAEARRASSRRGWETRRRMAEMREG